MFSVVHLLITNCIDDSSVTIKFFFQNEEEIDKIAESSSSESEDGDEEIERGERQENKSKFIYIGDLHQNFFVVSF